MARTHLTAQLLEDIAAAARTGLKNPQIYALLGIPRQRWSDWLRDEEGPLATSLRRERAKMAAECCERIIAMDPGWQRLVWLLCQHFPDDYARQVKMCGSASMRSRPLAGR